MANISSNQAQAQAQASHHEMTLDELRKAYEALAAKEREAKAALKAAKEKEKAAKKAALEAEKALKARPSGVIQRLAEIIIAESKAALEKAGKRNKPLSQLSEGEIVALCVDFGFTKDSLLPLLLKALNKDGSHEDAPNHRATIGAQIGNRINKGKLIPMGWTLMSGKPRKGETLMRYIAFPVKEKA